MWELCDHFLMKTFSKEPCNLLLFKQNHRHPVTLSHFYGLFNLILPSNWNCLFCFLSAAFHLCSHFRRFFCIFLLGDQTVNNKNAGKDWEKCIKILAKISSQKRYVTNGCPTLTDNRTVLLVKPTHTSQVRMFIKQAQYFHTSWLFGWTNKRWVALWIWRLFFIPFRQVNKSI